MPLILEDLPNELLLFIYNHLSIIDLLHSFYHLNRRFSCLVQTIKHLHVDFSSRPLSKTEFISITNQLHSLHIESIRISNRYYVDAISLFISYISFDQLVHLRSLSLIDIDRNTIEKLLHHYPKLTSLSIESSLWRTMPRRFLPYFSNLIHCHLPTLDILHGCHLNILELKLDHCTTDNLIQLNTFVPNLQALTLVLTNNINIPLMLSFPVRLNSLKLTLRSLLFTEFERLILMIGYLKNLSVSFSNTEHEVYCFDQYLFGQSWSSISQYADNLQLNIIVHRTLETFCISDLISNFDWFQRKIICQMIHDTNGYHLFSLPYIDRIYTMNYQENIIDMKHFDRVHNLHLTMPDKDIQCSVNPRTKCRYRNLRKLTAVIPYMTNSMISWVDNLLLSPRLRILELRLTSTTNNCRGFFDKLISRLPTSIEILILNTISTTFLSELLDNNNRLLSNLKCLQCSVKNRDHFDSLILLLLEIFPQHSLIYLNIYIENLNQSSNLLSGWLLKTNYLKKARIKCSDRQCAIWI